MSTLPRFPFLPRSGLVYMLTRTLLTCIVLNSTPFHSPTTVTSILVRSTIKSVSQSHLFPHPHHVSPRLVPPVFCTSSCIIVFSFFAFCHNFCILSSLVSLSPFPSICFLFSTAPSVFWYLGIVSLLLNDHRIVILTLNAPKVVVAFR